MAAFERIQCGIEGLDVMFDHIRLGDNVVWQLSTLSEFAYFVDPFVKRAIIDERDLIYIRFAKHVALVEKQPGVKIYTLDPHRGFEAFTIEVHEIITREGRDAFYVFDCLSELQTAWSADLMMGNFFRLTCPYLFELDTVAYFPIIRGRHSFGAIAKIRDTTQLLIDVAPDGDDDLYVRPLKVWNRYSTSMFLAHRYCPATGNVTTLTDGVETSGFYARMNEESVSDSLRNIDSWDRFFMQAIVDDRQGCISEETCTKMCNMMMTKDKRMRSMVKRYFQPSDYFNVRNRMIGTGLIGGKACGMLLARNIVETQLPQYANRFEAHDSYYIGTDVFYTYIVYNNLWKLRVAQRSEAGFVDAAPQLKQGLLNGNFPEEIVEAFKRMLDYYGQSPIIVRSSSFLEDGFGNAFAGKYDSVFCPNIGSFDERLSAFEQAVKHVYGSMLDPSALEYRRRNGLDRFEEQMALLVQRVSGSHYGNGYFMPTAAGVGYSRSAYCWMPDMDPDAGMLRLVMGLGTKAVDRTGSDYPRIISLDRPLATTAKTSAEKHRYSQRWCNLIDLNKREFTECSCTQLAEDLGPDLRALLFEHDRQAEARLRERGQIRDVLFASCEGIVENTEFTSMMRTIMETLEQAYEYPVDIEYTINVGEHEHFVVNLLQCRPLQALRGKKRIQIPELDYENTLFHIVDNTMGNSRVLAIDAVISVDPRAYYECPYAKKPLVATIVGKANQHYKMTHENVLLLSPGRIGTSSPELGVPVGFADISNLSALCEVAYSGAGYSPELSYGSHMFQDLVEANIYYAAIFEDSHTRCYRPQMLFELPDKLDAILHEQSPAEWDGLSPDLEGIVRIVETAEMGLTLWHDMLTNESICGVK